jgi:hypothetical protein
MDQQAFAQLLGNYGEFVGAIAVVATLVYLAVQIRQNTRSMDESRKFALVDSYVRRNDVMERALMQTAVSEDMAQILNQYYEGGIESLTPLQKTRLTFWERARHVRIESQFFQHQQGFLDDEYYENQFKSVVRRAAPRWTELGIQIERPSFAGR